MEIQEIKKLITDRYKFGFYSEAGLDIILSGIEKLSGDLRELLEALLTGKDAPQVEVEGYTVEKLKKGHGMNEIAAVLTLDWLKREPEEAKKSLKKGHDFIYALISPEQAKRLAIEYAKKDDYPHISFDNARVTISESDYNVWFKKTADEKPAEYLFRVNKKTGEVTRQPVK